MVPRRCESSRDRRDGTFDVDYDDGEKETRVEERNIRVVGGGGLARSPSRDVGGAGGRVEEGAKVEVNYHGRGRYYPGVISRDRRDGTFDIDYDDGEKETRVLERNIRVVGGGGLARSPSRDVGGAGGRVEEGAKVEVNYHGRGRYYPGVISRDRRDGTFDIDYDDGEKETRVEERNIRVVGGGGLARSPSRDVGGAGGRVEEGAKVEVNYHGRGRYYPGVISRDRRDGTFDIDYDDGEKETRVEERNIRVVGGGGLARSPSRDVGGAGGRVEEGAKVEVNYHGRGRYYPGVISRDRRDGTFDIDYDDGEKETRVEERNIRLIGGGGQARSPSRDVGGAGGRVEEGAKIEGNYRGRGRYYPGVISRDRRDGTFDIDYDDGEKETRVEERNIRVVGGGGLARSPSRDVGGAGGRVEEGAKIEGNYRGRGRYYPGVISRDRRDGTFDIDYDDGEKETRVEERNIRLIGGGGLARSPSRDVGGAGGRVEEGAKIEGNYRGRGRYYPGVISRDRRDGTFDIDYDDGEKETRVLERNIRVVGGGGLARSPSRDVGGAGGRVEEGAKIEGNYRGRGRWYPGVISRDRRGRYVRHRLRRRREGDPSRGAQYSRGRRRWSSSQPITRCWRCWRSC